MSPENTRHARGKQEWGPSLSRAAQLAAAADDTPAKRAPAKKDPARCKSAHGAPHVPVIALASYAASLGAECKWTVPWHPWESDEPLWLCRHEEQCGNCGKILRISVEPQECPGWHEPTSEERQAVAAAITENRERMQTRKPVITGSQGFRRKREAE